MNLVGKIFVGIIALMSVVCLTVSVVSYSSHHNWKEKNAALTKQLDEAKQEQKSLNDQKQELASKIEEEKGNYVNMIAALQTKTLSLEKANQALQEENTQLNADLAQRTDAIKANNSYIDDLRRELQTSTSNLASAQQLRANYLRDLAKTIEKLHELSAIYGDLKGQNDDLVKSYDDALTILTQNGLSPDPSAYGDLPKYGVKGLVETIKESAEGSLAMISLGSDDGLSEHNKLDVRRGSTYIGKLEVVSLEPNRAVCKVLPEYRQGNLMEGDDVYSQKLD